MKGAPDVPMPEYEKVLQVDLIVRAVDRRGKDLEAKWGFGRLPMLVPLDVAERFRVQRRKFTAAVWQYDPVEARKHGEAMLRAFDKLDELATAAGYSVSPPSQWEFEGPNGLVILVRDLADAGNVDTGGRKADVWSLDEIASVLRAQPVLGEVKNLFEGAVVESIRPEQSAKDALDDFFGGTPFA